MAMTWRLAPSRFLLMYVVGDQVYNKFGHDGEGKIITLNFYLNLNILNINNLKKKKFIYVLLVNVSLNSI